VTRRDFMVSLSFSLHGTLLPPVFARYNILLSSEKS
jgi:hypothetical protein